MSPFDERPIDARLTATDLLDGLLNESTYHTCPKMASTSARPTQYGLISEIFGICRAIFTCYLEGYGVEQNIDEGLTWLTRAARKGATNFQCDLAPIYLALGRLLPADLPLRKWMMYGVFFGNVGGARRILAS